MHSTKSALWCSLPCTSGVFISIPHRHPLIEPSLSPYILAGLPSNLILRKIGPTDLMPTLLTVWGLVVILQGRSQPLNKLTILANKHLGNVSLVTNFAGLLSARVLLGFAEGPMGCCLVCYLSGFYTHGELSLRFVFSISPACSLR